MFSRALASSGRSLASRPMAVSTGAAFSRYFTATTNFMSTEVYVGNLSFESLQQDVEQKFQEFGNVEDVRMINKPDGQFKGFAFVKFSDNQEGGQTSESVAQAAIDGLNDSVLNGRRMFVQPLKAKTDRPSFGSREGGGYGQGFRDGGYSRGERGGSYGRNGGFDRGSRRYGGSRRGDGRDGGRRNNDGGYSGGSSF